MVAGANPSKPLKTPANKNTPKLLSSTKHAKPPDTTTQEAFIKTTQHKQRPSLADTWVWPRGLRVFQKERTLTKHATLTLKPTYQAMVDVLFNPQQQGKLSFKDFKSLWMSVNGKIISNNGGSHHVLMGPTGEKFGIFFHSEGQTYGTGYIGYLQAPILCIGVRPTNW